MINAVPILSIVVVSYNTAGILRDCLRSIYSGGLSSPFQVIVVDNASADGSAEMVASEFPEVLLMRNAQNVGFAGANNQAFERAKGRYILLLNSDTICPLGSLNDMVGYLEDNKAVGAVGCRLLNSDRSLQPSVGNFPTPGRILSELLFVDRLLARVPFGTRLPYKMLNVQFYERTQSVDWLSGACLMVRSEVLNRVGPLDSEFFMYVEEVEWCYRIRRAGFEIHYLAEPVIIHLGGASDSGRVRAILNTVDGWLRFTRKHGTARTLLLVKLVIATGAIFRVVLGLMLQTLRWRPSLTKDRTAAYLQVLRKVCVRVGALQAER